MKHRDIIQLPFGRGPPPCLCWEVEACTSRLPLSPIFLFKCLSAGGAGSLPAEALLEACKNRGSLSQIFDLSLYRQEELVLCLRKLTLMHVKYKGATIVNVYIRVSFFVQWSFCATGARDLLQTSSAEACNSVQHRWEISQYPSKMLRNSVVGDPLERFWVLGGSWGFSEHEKSLNLDVVTPAPSAGPLLRPGAQNGAPRHVFLWIFGPCR